jgi:hypothetical protein
MTLAYLLKNKLEKATPGELQETPSLHKEEDDNLKDLVLFRTRDDSHPHIEELKVEEGKFSDIPSTKQKKKIKKLQQI